MEVSQFRTIGTVAARAFDEHVDAFTDSRSFRRLEAGHLSRREYDRFILNVARTHAKSPQLLAFLFALAPPKSATNVRLNMLEELGVADEAGEAHPALLEQLLDRAGLRSHLVDCRSLAEEDMRRLVTEPLLYGTLAEFGLAALVEVTGFEYMLLARVADRIGGALAAHRDLDSTAVEWFTHHGQVDRVHTEFGLDNLDSYVRYYGIDPLDATTIVEITIRENIFIKRYFADVITVVELERSR